jgi:hypothetical protein
MIDEGDGNKLKGRKTPDTDLDLGWIRICDTRIVGASLLASMPKSTAKVCASEE